MLPTWLPEAKLQALAGGDSSDGLGLPPQVRLCDQSCAGTDPAMMSHPLWSDEMLCICMYLLGLGCHHGWGREESLDCDLARWDSRWQLGRMWADESSGGWMKLRADGRGDVPRAVEWSNLFKIKTCEGFGQINYCYAWTSCCFLCILAAMQRIALG